MNGPATYYSIQGSFQQHTVLRNYLQCPHIHTFFFLIYFVVIKQRMQVYRTPYRSCVDCARTIMAREGWRAFYYSFGTQLVLNVPYQSLHFVVYEFVQDVMNPDRLYVPTSHVVSGAAAGAVAAALTTPFDVCKTLLNTQESGALARHGQKVHGIVSAARTVHQLKGIKGFFSGTTARVLFQIPSTAIAWFVYEFFKFALKNEWQRTHPIEAHVISKVQSVVGEEVHVTPRPGIIVTQVSATRSSER